MAALAGDYPLMAMMRRRRLMSNSWVLLIKTAFVVFEQWLTSILWLLLTIDGLDYKYQSPSEACHSSTCNRPGHRRVSRLWVRHLVDLIPPLYGTPATVYRLAGGQDEAMDEGHGVSVYSSSLLEDGISSSFPLSSFSLIRLVNWLVALDLAPPFLMCSQVHLVAVWKLMDEVYWFNRKRVRMRKDQCPVESNRDGIGILLASEPSPCISNSP